MGVGLLFKKPYIIYGELQNMSQTFYAGAGSKLAAGLQSSYFNNHATTVDTKLNITSATFDPSVEKGSEETLLMSTIKNGSYLLSIGMEGSFDANLRPEMTDWTFKAATQNATVDQTGSAPEGYTSNVYLLQDAGNDPLGSTFVLTKGDQRTTYPGMTCRSFTLNAPNNDFVTVSMDLVGREEIRGNAVSKITNAVPATTYEAKTDVSDDFTKSSYIVTAGVFKWQNTSWCIEDSTITIDNGIEDSPRCYQDKQYANIPVMGMRSVTLDFNLPYDNKIEDLKENYLLTSAYGQAELTFTNADDPNEKVNITIPNISITSVGSGISGTGVIEASVSGEAVLVTGDEAIIIEVITKD